MGLLEKLGFKKAKAPASGRTIKVGPNETLKKIAKREYGNENEWERIYEINKWRIDDPEILHPGQDLFIPDKD
jgi:nucleoid-associated protein YgaU